MIARGVGVAGLLLAAAGCSVVGVPKGAPAPVPEPRVAVEVPPVAPARELPDVAPPPPGDPILYSPVLRDSAFEASVRTWEAFWEGPEGAWFPRYLQRMAVYGPLVEGALSEAGLPASLRWLPLIESGYSPRAVSSASAVGLWQFMAPTAVGFGMGVGPLVDERRDPVKATASAVRYLDALHRRFGSWLLAVAAYNAGPTRLQRLLEAHAPGALPTDSLFLALAPHLPTQTRDYVPRLIAAARVGERWAGRGFELSDPPPPFAYDEVIVPDATTLDVVAAAAGVEEAAVVELNPQLVRRVTPKGQATAVRVPAGSGDAFREAYSRIPENRRVTSTEHVVEAGETLWEIARRYDVELEVLTAANPQVDPRRLRPGHRLLVPLVADGGPMGGAEPVEEAVPDVHLVQPGDTLWDLSRHYGLALEDLRRWNGLAEGDVIRPGQALRLGEG